MSKSVGIDKLEAMKAKMLSHKAGTGGGDFWKPPEGSSTIRILPPVGNMEFFWQEVGKHALSEDNIVMCPNFTTDGRLPCPICEASHEAYKMGGKEGKKIGDQFRVRRYYHMNVLVMGVDANTKKEAFSGPFIYTPGVKVYESLTAIVTDPEYGDISDAETGYDLKITRTGEKLDTVYYIQARKSPTRLGSLGGHAASDETMTEILSAAKDLSAVKDNLPTYEELARLIGYDDNSADSASEEEPEF